uniref:Uncharacterized protein n=1 Tax=Corethron hystrix TaxID=216773 RepID=A0A7S1FZ42_9STRA|mmetsp:Transcript_4409/g.8568  ORF Transcript_4409/g.8568 Transcript_4409/m.8568 type:complete len:118 (+) Transcript_4409:184-537(+)
MKAIQSVNSLYKNRGFSIRHALMDGQFLTLEGPLSKDSITLTTCSNDEHVGEIERMIQALKDRVRGMYSILSFFKTPGHLMAELVYWCFFWIFFLFIPLHSSKTEPTYHHNRADSGL